jgi:G3E family GTPase
VYPDCCSGTFGSRGISVGGSLDEEEEGRMVELSVGCLPCQTDRNHVSRLKSIDTPRTW